MHVSWWYNSVFCHFFFNHFNNESRTHNHDFLSQNRKRDESSKLKMIVCLIIRYKKINKNYWNSPLKHIVPKKKVIEEIRILILKRCSIRTARLFSIIHFTHTEILIKCFHVFCGREFNRLLKLWLFIYKILGSRIPMMLFFTFPAFTILCYRFKITIIQ